MIEHRIEQYNWEFAKIELLTVLLTIKVYIEFLNGERINMIHEKK